MDSSKAVKIVEEYFDELRKIRLSGGSTDERSNYVPLIEFINAIGSTVRPKIFCVGELADPGVGHPEIGLYTTNQIQQGIPRDGQKPERGIIEIKSVRENVETISVSDQMSLYQHQYKLVLITNFREFRSIASDSNNSSVRVDSETFVLADNEEEFDTLLKQPRKFAQRVGLSLFEYITRVICQKSVLANPKDVAWLLASYARDGLARVEMADDSPMLETVRNALEESLGLRFDEEKGKRFFLSTFIQTLFYGLFSAWVLWARMGVERDEEPLFSGGNKADNFNWRESARYLRTPVLSALFQQLSGPGGFQPYGLAEVMDWTVVALDRVDKASFFSKFSEGDAVQYFYEPFLAAFDPKLRKELGVWYTPPEVVKYMVARVDKALKEDLNVEDGLAGENVYVLDPCCGTGTYITEVLHRIEVNLRKRDPSALVTDKVKRAATERIFGFEIMPAPLVVAYLQIGLMMQAFGAPFGDDENGRIQVFLTNALTGWEKTKSKSLAIPELEEERDKAEHIKLEVPILVILGNPPYFGFAGVAVEEEQQLLEVYRKGNRVKTSKIRGLQDLYIRFFRMAERRITEKTGQGIVCFISNYSWLDHKSFAVMRERLLDSFNVIRIDCLNGGTRTGGKTPDGEQDESIFATDTSPGITLGTAITTLIRSPDYSPGNTVEFRNLWGQEKRSELMRTAEMKPELMYKRFKPDLSLGLPFVSTSLSKKWFDWPSLPDIFPVYFSGVQTGRDSFLTDIAKSKLRIRITDYFDDEISNEELKNKYSSAMKYIDNQKGFFAVRQNLIARGGPDNKGFIRCTYHPFDARWLYWEGDSKLLNRSRPGYKPHIFEGNLWLSSASHLRKNSALPQASVTQHMASIHLIEFGTAMYPLWLDDSGIYNNDSEFSVRPNLSAQAQIYLENISARVEDLFYFTIFTLHSPEYLESNKDALRLDWPRLPLPGWPDGKLKGNVEIFQESVSKGRELANLLDSEKGVSGVTKGKLRPEIKSIAVASTKSGKNMKSQDFTVNIGWGRQGPKGIVPGKGFAIERDYTANELKIVPQKLLHVLGESTFDIYLNDNAFWKNVPAAVWNYNIGGYQVLKKWLSYRELQILNRKLSIDEVQYFTDTARRIAAILIAVNK